MVLWSVVQVWVLAEVVVSAEGLIVHSHCHAVYPVEGVAGCSVFDTVAGAVVELEDLDVEVVVCSELDVDQDIWADREVAPGRSPDHSSVGSRSRS